MNKISVPQNLSPFFFADAYKLSHWNQYEKDIKFIQSNFTPRRSRVPGMNYFMFVGLQVFRDKLNELFNNYFFNLSEDEVVATFESNYQDFFGVAPDPENVAKIRALHKMKKLPICIRSIPEGSIVKHGTPVLTIHNTHIDFAWLTNWVETFMSAELWGISTSATTALYYKAAFTHYRELTSDVIGFENYQGHNFSARGMMGFEAAILSDIGHLVCFNGSDTLPGMFKIKESYSFTESNPFIATSIPATEHSCASSSGILKAGKLTHVVEEFDETTQEWKIIDFVQEPVSV